MAKKAKQQSQAQAADVSKEQQAEILRMANLSPELKAQAEAQGMPMGQYSQYRLEYQQAMCDAALTLLGLGHEKYVGNITPAQENYISSVIASAWAVSNPGITLKISEDRTLANFQTMARNICKAGSLAGWLKADKGEALNTRATLEALLRKKFTPKMGDREGFHSAARQAYEFIVKAQKQVAAGDLKLSQVSVGALVRKDKKKGRPQSAMAQERIDQFLDKLKLSSPTQVIRVIDDSIATLAAAVPLESSDPLVKSKLHAAHDWILREGKAYAEKARKVYQEALANMAHPSKDKAAKGATPAQMARIDAAAQAVGTVGPMQTPAVQDAPRLDAEHRIIHSDEVAKAKGKRTRKAKPVAGVGGAVQAAA